MTKQEYYKQVIEDFNRQIWDVELKRDFNRKRMEELERDLTKPSIIVPGDKQSKKAWGKMQQELNQRKSADEQYLIKIKGIEEQIEFVNEVVANSLT